MNMLKKILIDQKCDMESGYKMIDPDEVILLILDNLTYIFIHINTIKLPHRQYAGY